jgi:hypothetical protein
MSHLQKSKLRRLGNKMGQILNSAKITPYGYEIELHTGEKVYRDKKGWLHTTPPITASK